MKTAFDNLKLNDNYRVDSDKNGDKHVLKIYAQDELIAKKVKIKQSIRYFAIANYQDYLIENPEEI